MVKQAVLRLVLVLAVQRLEPLEQQGFQKLRSEAVFVVFVAGLVFRVGFQLVRELVLPVREFAALQLQCQQVLERFAKRDQVVASLTRLTV